MMAGTGEGDLGFYRDVLQELMDKGHLSPSMSVLVVCGGLRDVEVLREAGLSRGVVSNLASYTTPGDYAPFEWAHQDAEALSYPDASFDFAIVHSGLHHCRVPAKALTEMARVARRGVLVIEPGDNLLSRLGVRLGVGQEYELAAVSFNEGSEGGVANTDIPNYVYRFSARDVEKSLKSYFAEGRPRFLFRYRMRLPWQALKARRNKLPLLLLCAAWPALKVVERLAPAQANSFAAIAFRPGQTHPWVRQEGATYRVNPDGLHRAYRPEDTR